LRSQKAEFVLKVAADAAKAQEKIDALRKEQEDRAIRLRVVAEEGQAERRIDEMRAEQEARPIDLRVNVDETAYSRLSRAVDSARQQVVNANEAVIASDRRVDASRRQSQNAADGVVASERRIENARLAIETNAQKIAAAERNVNEVRKNQATQVNPLLTAAESALERARAKGNAADIARSERNLSEMRKALGPQTDEITRAENTLADTKRRGQILENSLAQAIDSGVGARRRAAGAEDSLTQSIDNTSNARRRAEQASRNLTRTVEDENARVRDLSRELNTLGKDFEKAIPVSGFADAFSSIAPIISLLPLLATGLAEAAGGAEQLGGAVLAWPGMFAGLASSFGTLLTGIHGVTDAYKALSTSAKDSGNDQVTQARDTREANEQLTSATRAQSNAERERSRAVRDSRQEMADLNLQLRGGQLDTASAILEAQKARRDLATGHYNDGLDYQEAQLRVQQSDLRVSESLSSQNRLRDRSADIGDRVVSANEQVAQANERVAKAQEHLNDVTTKVSASQRALNTAMAQLAPNAQEFVKTIFDLMHSGALKELQNDTQQNLFAGMSDSIKTLVNSDLPTLKTGFGSIATTMNADFKQLFSSLGSDHTKGILSSIFGDTSQAQDLLKTAIDPLVSAFGTLAKAGADTLPRMADGIGRAADRFSKFIDAADKDGRLDAWINAGITGFTRLGDIFINLGQSLNGITKALGGQGFLATLDDATKRLDTFLNSTKGQNDLRRIFADGRAELEQLKPILDALPSIFKSAFGAAKEGMGIWLPILQTATGLLKDFPGLAQDIFEGFLVWKSLGPVFSLVRDGIGFLETGLGSVQTQITNSRVLAGSEMSRTATIFKKVAGEEGVGKFAGALSGLSAAGGPILALSTLAIPALIWAFGDLDKAADQSREHARQLEQQEHTLEDTLDRVTGKMTGATRAQAIQNARQYDTTGAPGGGKPGISKGDALAAATSLGIAPDVYGNALTGDVGAAKNVKDVLIKNNLATELQSNSVLQKELGSINQATGGKVSSDLLVRALIGDPDALKQFNDVTKDAQLNIKGLTLTDLAQQFSQRGQQAILSGGALNQALAAIPGAQANQQTARQAQYGRATLSDQGVKDLGLPANTQIDPFDNGFTVSVSAQGMTAQLQDTLKRMNITPKQLLYGQGWSFDLPLGSRDVKKYDKGGPTPAAVGPLPGGGHPAIVHPDEWMANSLGRRTLGDSFLGAANKGAIDLSLLPHFDIGGPGANAITDDNGNPISAGRAPGPGDELGPTGAAPTTGPQGILPALVTGFASAAQTIGNDANMVGALPGAGGAPGAGGNPMASMPGLWGLPAAMKTPGGMQQWTNQTLGWLGNWGGKFLGGLGSDLLGTDGSGGGMLGFLGLQNSILSPNNPWTKAGTQGVGGLMQHFGAGALPTGGLGDILSRLMSLNGGANPAVSSILGGGAGPQLDPSTAGAITGGAGGVSPSGMVIGANPKSKATAITGAPNVGTNIQNAPAGMFTPLFTPNIDTGGYGNSKGLPQWAIDFGAQFGLAPSSHSGSGTHGLGFAMDFSPTPDNKDPVGSMDRFASFISQNLGSQTLQLIHWDPGTGDTANRPFTGAGQHWGMAAGKPVDAPGGAFQDYYMGPDEGYNEHVNHVHWATDVPVVMTPQGPAWGPGTTMNTDAGGAVIGSPSGFTSPSGTDWDKVHAGEAGAWNTNTGNGFFGGLQFKQSSWEAAGGLQYALRADLATPDQQKMVAERLLKMQGPGAWPNTYPAGAPKLFDTGSMAGYIPPGQTVVQNDTGKNEAIFTHQEIETFHQLADTNNNVAQQIKPTPPPPDVQHMQPNARSQAPAQAGQQPGVGIGPGTADVPAQPAQLAPAAAGQPQQNQVNTLGAGPLTAGSVGSDDTGMHVLPALKTGIMSTANTLGGLASQAISAAASAGSFGAGGAAGGAAGSLVAGLFNEAGKIAVDVVNVPSSFMVSNWAGKGASPNASGAAYHPTQQPLATAHVNTTNYNGGINGHDMNDVITELNIRDSQQQQSAMANTRAWP
jgi:hypothetical protein